MPETTAFENDVLDLTPLESQDEYARYFSLMYRVFTFLVNIQRAKSESGNQAADAMSELLEKLLFTFELMRIRRSYDPVHNVRIDLTDSGFPNQVEFRRIQVDLQERDGWLQDTLPSDVLQYEILNHLLANQTDPVEMLQQMGERVYFENLEEEKVFLPFTHGKLTRNTAAENGAGMRSYTYTWGCFDIATNRPSLYRMDFEQDDTDPALEDHKEARAALFKVIVDEGGRAPLLGIVAIGLDRALETIHPKRLERINLGPVYSQAFSVNHPKAFDDLFSHARPGDDFACLFEVEILYSKGTKLSRWNPVSGGAREVFHINKLDRESYQRKVSNIHRYMLMPHLLAQHAGEGFTPYAGYQKITFDREGVLHGI